MPKVPLPKQKRLQQHLLSQKPSQPSEVDDGDDDNSEELDFHRGYSRPKLVSSNLWDDDTELPDHINERLEQIRGHALQKYREVML
jgi:hypothetical protein